MSLLFQLWEGAPVGEVGVGRPHPEDRHPSGGQDEQLPPKWRRVLGGIPPVHLSTRGRQDLVLTHRDGAVQSSRGIGTRSPASVNPEKTIAGHRAWCRSPHCDNSCDAWGSRHPSTLRCQALLSLHPEMPFHLFEFDAVWITYKLSTFQNNQLGELLDIKFTGDIVAIAFKNQCLVVENSDLFVHHFSVVSLRCRPARQTPAARRSTFR